MYTNDVPWASSASNVCYVMVQIIQCCDYCSVGMQWVQSLLSDGSNNPVVWYIQLMFCGQAVSPMSAIWTFYLMVQSQKQFVRPFIRDLTIRPSTRPTCQLSPSTHCCSALYLNTVLAWKYFHNLISYLLLLFCEFFWFV